MAEQDEIGSFEKHTKGIGMKLLKSMGYKPGEGLGRDKSGIDTPIEIHSRPKGAGLGYDPTLLAQEQKTKIQNEEKDDYQPENKKFKSVMKVKHKVNLLIQEALATKTIDLEGKEISLDEHLITSQHQLEQYEQQREIEKSTRRFVELNYNLDRLVDLCETNIFSIAKSLNESKKQLKSMEETLINRKSKNETLESTLETLEKIKLSFDWLNDNISRFETNSFSQEAFTALFKNDQVAEYFISILEPRIKKSLVSWNPIEDFSKEILFTFQKIHQIYIHLTSDMNFYKSHLIIKHLIPKLRSCILNEWNSLSDTALVVALLQEWKPLIDIEVFEQLILFHCIHSKIRSLSQAWNPFQEAPFTQWLLPIFQITSQKEHFLFKLELEVILIDTILPKYFVLLQKQWNEENFFESLYEVSFLTKQYISTENFKFFCIKCIIPFLLNLLRTSFSIDPSDQQIEPFQNVMRWNELVGSELMVPLWEAEFFPRFISVLTEWLSSPTVDYAEIADWYIEWKKMFPKEYFDLKTFRTQYIISLNLIRHFL